MLEWLLLLVLVLVIVFGLSLIFRSIRFFVVNAVIGLAIIFLANSIAGLGISYNLLLILICAFGGILGALLVLLLHFLGLGF